MNPNVARSASQLTFDQIKQYAEDPGKQLTKEAGKWAVIPPDKSFTAQVRQGLGRFVGWIQNQLSLDPTALTRQDREVTDGLRKAYLKLARDAGGLTHTRRLVEFHPRALAREIVRDLERIKTDAGIGRGATMRQANANALKTAVHEAVRAFGDHHIELQIQAGNLSRQYAQTLLEPKVTNLLAYAALLELQRGERPGVQSRIQLDAAEIHEAVREVVMRAVRDPGSIRTNLPETDKVIEELAQIHARSAPQLAPEVKAQVSAAVQQLEKNFPIEVLRQALPGRNQPPLCEQVQHVCNHLLADPGIASNLPRDYVRDATWAVVHRSTGINLEQLNHNVERPRMPDAQQAVYSASMQYRTELLREEHLPDPARPVPADSEFRSGPAMFEAAVEQAFQELLDLAYAQPRIAHALSANAPRDASPESERALVQLRHATQIAVANRLANPSAKVEEGFAPSEREQILRAWATRTLQIELPSIMVRMSDQALRADDDDLELEAEERSASARSDAIGGLVDDVVNRVRLSANLAELLLTPANDLDDEDGELASLRDFATERIAELVPKQDAAPEAGNPVASVTDEEFRSIITAWAETRGISPERLEFPDDARLDAPSAGAQDEGRDPGVEDQIII